MTNPTDYQKSDTESKSTTPVKGSSIVIQQVKVSNDGIFLLLKAYTKSVTFLPSRLLAKKDISLAYGQIIAANQDWFQVATKLNHPMVYEAKNLESSDVDFSHLTLKEGDILGTILQIHE